jgi:hypothetical protein
MVGRQAGMIAKRDDRRVRKMRDDGEKVTMSYSEEVA